MLKKCYLFKFVIVFAVFLNVLFHFTPVKAAYEVTLDFFNVGQGHCGVLKIKEEANSPPRYALFDAGSSSLAQELKYSKDQPSIPLAHSSSRRKSNVVTRSRQSLMDTEFKGNRKKPEEEELKQDLIQKIRETLGEKTKRSTINVDLVVISHKDIDHSGWLRDIFNKEDDHIGSLIMGSFPEDYNFQTLHWIEKLLHKQKKTNVFFPSLTFDALQSLTDVLPIEAIKERKLSFLEKKEMKKNKTRNIKNKRDEEKIIIQEEEKEEQEKIQSRFTESWERDSSYADCAYYSIERNEVVTVSGMQRISEEFQKAFKLSETVGIHLLIANASHSLVNNVGIRKTLESDDNSDSLVIKIQHREFSAILPGDATGVTTDCIAALYKEKEKFLEATVLLASHHGSIADKTNSQKWLELVNPEYVVVSNGFKFGHPDEGVFQRLYKDWKQAKDKAKRLHLVSPVHKILTNTSMREDWIIHETQQAIFSTLGSGTISVVNKGTGETLLSTERDGKVTIISRQKAQEDHARFVDLKKEGNTVIATPKKEVDHRERKGEIISADTPSPLKYLHTPKRKRELPKEEPKRSSSTKKTKLLSEVPFSFDNPRRDALKGLEAYRLLKVNYRDAKPEIFGLYEKYILGAVIGDGDCFFHAVFTKKDQQAEQVTKGASIIRKNLEKIIKKNASYKDIMRRELLAECKTRKNEQGDVLKEVYEKLEANKKHEEVREKERKQLTSQLSEEIFEKNYQELEETEKDHIQDLVFGKLPDFLKPRALYQDQELLKLISDDAVLNYIKRYESNSGERSYIELPVGRGELASIARVIAESQGVLVHCFLYDVNKQELNYKGSLGPKNSHRIASILHYGNHYWALYNKKESEERRQGIIQADLNAHKYL